MQTSAALSCRAKSNLVEPCVWKSPVGLLSVFILLFLSLLFFIILNIKSFFPTYIHTCLLFSLVNVLLIRTLWRHIYFLHLLSCVCPYSCHRACAVCPAGLWWRCPVAPSSRCGSSTASDPNDSEASHYCETQGNMNTQTRHQLWPVTTLTHIIKNKYCIAAR